MRIAIMSREYPPDTGWGGIATYKYHLAHGLKALGHKVEVFSLCGNGPEHTGEENGILVHRVQGHNHVHNERLIRECDNDALFEIHKCVPHLRYVVNASLALWRRFDEIHTQQPFEVVDAPELFADSLFVSMRRDVPLVIRLYTPHAKFIAEQLHNIDRSLDHEMVAMMERFAMYECDVITSPSCDLAQWVANDLHYPLDKIMIVRDPIDCELFNPEGNRAFVAPEQVKVLFVGRMEERKGVHYLVDAIPEIVARNPRVHFYFLGADTKTGPAGASVLKELKRRLKASGHLHSATFISPVPHVEVPDYMRSADLCIVPSLYDNSPFTCIEALASGKPVIGTSAGGTPEYIVDGEVGLVIPARDTKAIVESVLSLANDKERAKRMGVAARQWAQSQYAREIIAAQNLEVYRSARRQFIANGGHPLSRQPRSTFIKHSDELANSLDLAFHELRLRWSLSYRVRTALHKSFTTLVEFSRMLRQRPKLAVAQALLLVLSPLRKRQANSGLSTSSLSWLEKQIVAKQAQEAEQQAKQPTGAGSSQS